jgi:cytoplasmic tRNA 2-thiolation protein 1
VTGHNADDIAETVYMNILRGDFFRLGKCVEITTGLGSDMPRAKPFKYTYEKEIVMYAHFKKLDYFSTECIYSPNAYRGYVRELIKDLEVARPSTILDIIHSAESVKIDQEKVEMPVKRDCVRCGYISSNELCKACVLLEGLNSGKAKEANGRKSNKVGIKIEETKE